MCVLVFKECHDIEYKYSCLNYRVSLQRELLSFRLTVSQATSNFMAAVMFCKRALSSAVKEQRVKRLQKLSFIAIHHHTWCLSTSSESDTWSGALNITWWRANAVGPCRRCAESPVSFYSKPPDAAAARLKSDAGSHFWKPFTKYWKSQRVLVSYTFSVIL